LNDIDIECGANSHFPADLHIELFQQAGWISSPAQMRTRLHSEKNISHLDDEIVVYFVSSPA